jgi:hypothetical protein
MGEAAGGLSRGDASEDDEASATDDDGGNSACLDTSSAKSGLSGFIA